MRRARFLRRRTDTGSGADLRRYLGDDEVVLLATRQHPWALVGALRDALVLIVPLVMFAWGIAGLPFGGLMRIEVGGERIVWWVLAALLVVGVVVVIRLAGAVIAWEFERAVITSEKVMHIQGVLHRRIAATPLVKLSEMQVSQGVVGRMLGFGALLMDAPGGGTPLHGLRYLPDPAAAWRLVTSTARGRREAEGGSGGSASGGSTDDAMIEPIGIDAEYVTTVLPIADPWEPESNGPGSIADPESEQPGELPGRSWILPANGGISGAGAGAAQWERHRAPDSGGSTHSDRS